jgi:hypothetical protein
MSSAEDTDAPEVVGVVNDPPQDGLPHLAVIFTARRRLRAGASIKVGEAILEVMVQRLPQILEHFGKRIGRLSFSDPERKGTERNPLPASRP